MRAHPRLVATILAGLLAAQPAAAEPVGSYLYFAPFGGYAVFDRDIHYPGPRPITNEMHFGGRLGFQVTRWLGIEASGGYSPTSVDVSGGKDVNFLIGSGNVTLTPFSGSYGGPFLLLGAGASRLASEGERRVRQLNAEAGAGVQLWLSDMVGVRLEARNLAWLPKEDLTNPIAHSQIYTGGVTFAIGARARDTDGDGVPDRRDRCPGTPSGALADASGCPIDSDNDGVYDGLDQCAGTPRGATVTASGCPEDSDGDGVFNGLDQCADTPQGATVDLKGCSFDSDNDGVLDGLDQCANTPQGATVDTRGCPTDSDDDGIPDGIDRCPGTSPGLQVDKDGCPIEVTERETEMLDTGMIRLENVNFETGKADLQAESLPQLDIVGQVLSKWPDLRIEIGGHTDSRGSEAYNQKLSEARVQSVLDYLLEKFPNLQRDRYTVKGYGEAAPLVPNTSPLNMAKNRRVEFKVLNTDVLRREVEHRKLLKKD